MNRIDCTKAEGYLIEKARMCNSCYSCDSCSFPTTNTALKSCGEMEENDVLRAISIVQKWSDEHPPKTRFDDFKEKIPKANCDDIYADVLPSLFGYCKNCTSCSISLKTPPRCWDEPVDGGATGNEDNS